MDGLVFFVLSKYHTGYQFMLLQCTDVHRFSRMLLSSRQYGDSGVFSQLPHHPRHLALHFHPRLHLRPPRLHLQTPLHQAPSVAFYR